MNTVTQNIRAPACLEKAGLCAPAVRMLVRQGSCCIVSFFCNNGITPLLRSRDAFAAAQNIFSGYSAGGCKGALFIPESKDIESQYKTIESALKRCKKSEARVPALVALQNTGFFSAAATKADADAVMLDFLYSIDNKIKLAAPRAPVIDCRDNGKLRACGKIAVITGSGQGIGKGIAGGLAEAGAYIVVADINLRAAREVAAGLCRAYGKGKALAVGVDVTSEESIKNMMLETVLAYGGIDVFISNAGILKAGSLEEMDAATFDRVTKINYSAYYLGTKYASRYMKVQHRFDKGYFSDIIQINSKSGLEGSNRNFAYAGGKFGGIGLTQSFALELVGHNIKVNALCPGNFFEGPLWADPESGLFAQYLRTKKVPGARTIDDVKKYYESKVPMKRGCSARDVTRAVLYLIEQTYETGQALPVTGGQVMLR